MHPEVYYDQCDKELPWPNVAMIQSVKTILKIKEIYKGIETEMYAANSINYKFV